MMLSRPESEGDGDSTVVTGVRDTGLEAEEADLEATFNSSFSFLKRRTRFHILTFSDPNFVVSRHNLFLSAKTSSRACVGS